MKLNRGFPHFSCHTSVRHTTAAYMLVMRAKKISTKPWAAQISDSGVGKPKELTTLTAKSQAAMASTSFMKMRSWKTLR